MGDAVVAAIDNQDLPDGYYHLDRMLKNLARKGADSAAAAPASMRAVSPRSSWSTAPAAQRWRSSPTGRSRPTAS
jgi:hypothetical protein